MKFMNELQLFDFRFKSPLRTCGNITNTKFQLFRFAKFVWIISPFFNCGLRSCITTYIVLLLLSNLQKKKESNWTISIHLKIQEYEQGCNQYFLLNSLEWFLTVWNNKKKKASMTDFRLFFLEARFIFYNVTIHYISFKHLSLLLILLLWLWWWHF